MNIEAQNELNRILSLEPAALTLDEMAFLRARRSYLNSDQVARFESVLTDEGQDAEPKAPADMTKRELVAELTARNIPFDPKAKQPELAELLQSTPTE
jgi:hypothetical protein